MARLISLREMGELSAWIKCSDKLQHITVKKRIMPDESQYQGKDNDAWLNARLPSLYGPHSNRPRTQVLWALTHVRTKD